MQIEYRSTIDHIEPSMLTGFFVGWPKRPSPEVHLRLLQRSDAVEVAFDPLAGRLVGFCTALTDEVLTADITMLEVLREYRRRGIGTRLTQRMLERFSHLYAINIICDADVQSFYARLGLKPCAGMMLRRYDRQEG